MPKVAYTPRKFSDGSRSIIDHANEIIEEYQDQGFVLTLRQLYYQFVSRDLLANTVQNYKRLGSIVNDARLAGLVDWEAIEDRTRNLAGLSHWSEPSELVAACAEQFRVDKWATQPWRVEVWIEKEALAGVFERVCEELDVPYLSCRGYTSQSEMWVAAMRLRGYTRKGQNAKILHFGDHDPSGIDMTRDIRDRLAIFGADLELERIALNMDQVEEHEPPPNPAKETDSRFAGYIREYGGESWELDALEPQLLAQLVRTEIENVLDEDAWKEAEQAEATARQTLAAVSKQWVRVEKLVAGGRR